MTNKKVSVYADLFSAVAFPISAVLVIGLGVWLTVFLFMSRKDGAVDLIICIFFALATAALIAAFISMSPRALARFTFTAEGVYCHIPFKPKELVPYKNYPYLFKASYRHGNLAGMGKRRYFLVFTNRRLKPSELEHINGSACSRDLIKVQLTGRNVERLREILPSGMAARMEAMYRQTE